MQSFPFIVLAGIVLTIVSTTSVDGAVQSWQRLADSLNVSDSETLIAIQGIAQAWNGTGATARAFRACSIAQVIFNSRLQAVDDVPEYIGPYSTLYTNRTQIYWYVPKGNIIATFLERLEF